MLWEEFVVAIDVFGSLSRFRYIAVTIYLVDRREWCHCDKIPDIHDF